MSEPPGGASVWQVGEALDYVQGLLESESNLNDIWIEGEVTNLTRAASGHLYFSLKDAESKLDCVLFKRKRGPVEIDNGDAIAAHGRLAIYRVRGQLQMIVDAVAPKGIGELALRFEQLRARLEDEGLFDPDRKRPLPQFPAHIGLVTSPTGAVLHDIVTVLERRYPLCSLTIAPTSVQGAEAPAGIVAGIEALNRRDDIDVIIVARGGGSPEERWAFNEEIVARAIFASRTPIVSAVGHETDFSIADFVADLRAPTPTAGAELVTPDRAELVQQIAARRTRMTASVQRTIAEQRHKISLAGSTLKLRLPDLLSLRQRVDDRVSTLSRQVGHQLALERERLAAVASSLATLSPTATLQRGYAVITEASSHSVIRTIADTAGVSAIDVAVSDGEFGAVLGPSKRSPRRRAASHLQSSMTELIEAAGAGAHDQ